MSTQVPGGNGQPGIDRSEHIGVEDGESINAKRVGTYVWDSTLLQWVRMAQPATVTNYLTKIDTTTTSNAIYIGKAALTGSAVSTASAVWQIKKLDTSTLALDKKFADGNTNFDNIWDNRASLTYN